MLLTLDVLVFEWALTVNMKGGRVQTVSGMVLVGLGPVFFLGPCGVPPGGVTCTIPTEFSLLGFLLGIGGLAAFVLGVLKTGIARKRMVAEGGGPVTIVGVAVLLASLFLSGCGVVLLGGATCGVSTTQALMGYVLGILGGALFVGGVQKIRNGKKAIAAEASPLLPNKKPPRC